MEYNKEQKNIDRKRNDWSHLETELVAKNELKCKGKGIFHINIHLSEIIERPSNQTRSLRKTKKYKLLINT